MEISRGNGWTYNTDTGELTWPDVATGGKLPTLTQARWVYMGMGYDESQAAARTVNAVFKKRYADANHAGKVADVPKDAKYMPDSDSDEYRAELLVAHKALFAKFLVGYGVAVREGDADPVQEQVYKLARRWLTGIAVAKGWFVLPSKKQLGADEDVYNDPKGRFATFGEALDAFTQSTAPASAVQGKDERTGKPYPAKAKHGESICDLLVREATRLVEEADQGKKGISIAEGDVEF